MRSRWSKPNEKSSEESFSAVAIEKENNTLPTFQRKLFSFLLLFRILNAWLVRTWFVPDEYWQGPEVAHRLAFGYGYLTWEWKQGLRGYTLPLVYSIAYKVLYILGLDSAEVVIFIPNVIQAVLAAVGDLYLYKLAIKLFGPQAAKWALLCNLSSWFTFYCVTRTLSNSWETVLTTIALYYWPLELLQTTKVKDIDQSSNISISLIVAAFACIIRPTSAILWLPLSTLHIIRTERKLYFILLQALPVGLLALCWSLVIDSFFYGHWMVVQLNFLLFNVVKDLGTFYGSHPWHWYFTQGFPAIIFTHLPLFLCGVYKSSQRILAALVMWVLMVYSFLGHKEFRFIFPVLPICMCYAGNYLVYLNSSFKSGTKSPSKKHTLPRKITIATIVFGLVCASNAPIALYTSLIHQRGVLDMMGYLRQEANVQHKPITVMFLMPCHSTPFYSHIHKNISMRFLECPPNDNPDYIDEADRFYRDPMKWLDGYLATEHITLPTHIVHFSVLTQCAEFFHTHIPEGRIGGSVHVHCIKTNSTRH
ncbi:GPI mannosyltransferase 3 isoform X2 [Nematostella vectensis]|uniref:GPI mannosyltransferase 3 isoform X2 n=1 Tax=Nematostella vectensis TaxID=45351 RepID=UPI001390377E|nr:GPI mannosyltransferase 3 isoform X2 [Nematostella vectensis]